LVHRLDRYLSGTQLNAIGQKGLIMSSPYLSQIIMFGGNYAPKQYALCNGTLMSIQQNTALFSLLGTTYGGNGVNNFALPNLQSALPVSFGQAPGLSNYVLGQIGGTPQVTLNQTQVPPHQHFMMASTSSSATTSATVSNTVLPGTPSVAAAVTQAPAPASLYANPPGQGQPPLIPVALAGGACSTVGNNQPHSNLMPSQCVSFCIAISGVFPTRN
jgi:microcystin-dependent protein